MVGIINFTSSNFARQLVSIIRLASVSCLFASFTCSTSIQCSEQIPLVFNVSQQFSWQSLGLLLGMFYPNGRSFVWEFDDLVESVNICSFFMVIEPFVNAQFRATVPPNFFQCFRQNRFCVVLFCFKGSWLSVVS